MISKNKIKQIHSLNQKKVRKAEGLYIAEGPKAVGDILVRHNAHDIIATREWIDANPNVYERAETVTEVSADELARTSLLQTPQQVIGVFEQPHVSIEQCSARGQLVLALDGVQDPGNLGTIVRIADWFGISTIVCSTDTADLYNPKAVQATMGSIARVNVAYTDLPAWLSQQDADTQVFATALDGENIYSAQLPQSAVIVMGNEGKGISAEVKAVVKRRLLIPCFNTSADCPDSLNVAIATAIACSEFRRVKAM